MPLVRFTHLRITREAEPQRFEAGQVYDLPAASCERWVRRGCAEHVAAKPAAAEAQPRRHRASAAPEQAPLPD